MLNYSSCEPAAVVQHHSCKSGYLCWRFIYIDGIRGNILPLEYRSNNSFYYCEPYCYYYLYSNGYKWKRMQQLMFKSRNGEPVTSVQYYLPQPCNLYRWFSHTDCFRRDILLVEHRSNNSIHNCKSNCYHRLHSNSYLCQWLHQFMLNYSNC